MLGIVSKTYVNRQAALGCASALVEFMDSTILTPYYEQIGDIFCAVFHGIESTKGTFIKQEKNLICFPRIY